MTIKHVWPYILVGSVTTAKKEGARHDAVYMDWKLYTKELPFGIHVYVTISCTEANTIVSFDYI